MRHLLVAAAAAALCACDGGGQPPSQQEQHAVEAVELRGDAALYYLYRQHLTNEGMGPQGRYYLSKEGRVFYKDWQDRQHTVNPPSEGLRVPRPNADPYRGVRGYAGQEDGRDLRRLAADDRKK